VFGTSVITAITAQNTLGVTAWTAVAPELVASQLDAVVSDLRPNALKSGMLGTDAVIRTVAAAIESHRLEQYVLDPVMVATSGDLLLETGAVDVLRSELLPLSRIVTPNLPETALLLDAPLGSPDEMADAARALVAFGAGAALIKGGHLDGPEVVDVLFDGGEVREFRRERLHTRNLHGTGCTLAAAIAAGLALGQSLGDAVESALAYVHRAIATAPELGAGHGPLNHWA
jgi:hydroxymethylpyrimidine/phosphomethylpyrimidine kinase